MIESILYNEIPVKNMQESIRWYKEILGFELIWYSEEESLAQLNLPSRQMLFLVETGDKTNANFTVNGRQHNVIGFYAKNMDQLYSHLVQHNVRVEEIVDDGKYKFLNFFDLDGNMFNVQCDTAVGLS